MNSGNVIEDFVPVCVCTIFLIIMIHSVICSQATVKPLNNLNYIVLCYNYTRFLFGGHYLLAVYKGIVFVEVVLI